MSKDGTARAAQALAPRVANSFLNRQNIFIRRSSVSFSIKLTALQANGWAET